MAFTVEDGTGIIGANAYMDAAAVTTYLTDRARETENNWSTAGATAQQAAIIKATDYIEKVFGYRFLGRRTNETQGLSWPRINVFDRDGFKIEDDTMPEKLLQATAEYSVRALSSVLLPDPTIDDSGKAITGSRQKVGPIETETQFEEGGGASNVLRPYPAADRLLRDLLAPAGSVIRG